MNSKIRSHHNTTAVGMNWTQAFQHDSRGPSGKGGPIGEVPQGPLADRFRPTEPSSITLATPNNLNSHPSPDFKPIGKEGTLKLLEQIRVSVKDQVRESSKVQASHQRDEPVGQPGFHMAPEEQALLMARNSQSLARVKSLYQGMAQNGNSLLVRQGEIYDDLGKSLSETWKQTRSLRSSNRSL